MDNTQPVSGVSDCSAAPKGHLTLTDVERLSLYWTKAKNALPAERKTVIWGIRFPLGEDLGDCYRYCLGFFLVAHEGRKAIIYNDDDAWTLKYLDDEDVWVPLYGAHVDIYKRYLKEKDDFDIY